jgi:hypothetical protein
VTIDCDRLITAMIRQFFAHPGEFLSFDQLARRIPESVPELLHGIAEAKPELFLLTRRGDAAKLHTEAFEEIIEERADLTTLHPIRTPEEERIGGSLSCEHLSEDEILADLACGSALAESLLRRCCWKRICEVRGLNPGFVDAESWVEICRVRNYLLSRQKPRGR